MLTKLCAHCGAAMPFDAAANKNSKASGFFNSHCWGCYLARNRAAVAERRATEDGKAQHRADNRKYPTSKTATAKAQRKYRSTAHAAELRRASDRARAPRPKVVLAPGKRAQYRQTANAWKKANPHKVNPKTAARRAAKLCRTPAWADMAEITKVYADANAQGLTVDHIVPLQGELVSGLHVHYNLQLLTREANASKKNHYVVD